jgi:hypothetical protein
VGLSEGDSVGIVDGLFEGEVVGYEFGTKEGDSVKITEGIVVGTVVGKKDG